MGKIYQDDSGDNEVFGESPDLEPGIMQADMAGMEWKTALPGLGIIGLLGTASALWMRRRKRALLAIESHKTNSN